MGSNQWRRFELTTKDELQVKELDQILAKHRLNSRELAVIVSTLRLRPEFTLADFSVERSKITARPMSETEIKSLAERAESAIQMLQVWMGCTLEDKGENDATKMFDSAINIFTELRREWLLAVGHPQEISGETLRKIVDATAEHMKAILKQRIAEGQF